MSRKNKLRKKANTLPKKKKVTMRFTVTLESQFGFDYHILSRLLDQKDSLSKAVGNAVLPILNTDVVTTSHPKGYQVGLVFEAETRLRKSKYNC